VYVPAEGTVTAVPMLYGLYCCSAKTAAQPILALVQKGCMVHALVVVTVQEASFFPKRGEFCGKIGFLITNNVFAAYFAVSLPAV
jgi:hypothetical protein